MNIGTKTVERAAEFTQSVDRIVQVTGIHVNDLLDDKIRGSMEEINTLAGKDIVSLKRVIQLIVDEGASNLDIAFRRLYDEETERISHEIDEKRRLEAAKLKAKRDEDEANERERLRIAHEERVKQENERLAKSNKYVECRKDPATGGILYVPVKNIVQRTGKPVKE